MTGVANDISLNTLVLSGVVALVGYGLKTVGAALIDAVKKLVVHLIETTAEVKMLKVQLTELVQTVGDVQKIRLDLNGFYDRLKKLETKMNDANGQY